MNEIAHLLLASTAGLALGAFYYQALWWTVQRVVKTQRPFGLMVGSFVVRNVVVLGGFWCCGTRGWQGLIAAFVGFLVMRVVFVRKLGPQPGPEASEPTTTIEEAREQETNGR